MSIRYNLEAPRATLGLNAHYSNHLHQSLAPNNRAIRKCDIDQDIHAPPESSGEETGGEEVHISNATDSDRCIGVPLGKKNPKRRDTHTSSKDDLDEFDFQRSKKTKATFGKSGRTVKPRINKRTPNNSLSTKKSPDANRASTHFKVPGGQKALVVETVKPASISKPVFNNPLAYGNFDSSLETKSLGPVFQEPLPATNVPSFIDPRSKASSFDRDRPIEAKRTQRLKQIELDPKPNKASRALATFTKTIDAESAYIARPTKVSTAFTTSTASSNSNSPFSSPRSNDVAFSSSASTNLPPPSPEPEPEPEELKCPYCNGPVTPSVLHGFISERLPFRTGRLNIHQQRVFCRHHRVLDAKNKWKVAGYPEIEWSTLPRRLEPHKSHIASVIDDETPCYYRQRLRDLDGAQRAKGGRQTVAQEFQEHGDGGELLGYYGTRGARIIGDFIMTNFKRNLKGLQKRDDDLLISGGIGSFVQAVLVPEIVQRLIIQDSRLKHGERSPEVEASEARIIMENSSDLGRLLCEEEEDVVEAETDDETGGYGE